MYQIAERKGDLVTRFFFNDAFDATVLSDTILLQNVFIMDKYF